MPTSWPRVDDLDDSLVTVICVFKMVNAANVPRPNVSTNTIYGVLDSGIVPLNQFGHLQGSSDSNIREDGQEGEAD
jgi:hypothetical protein